VVVERFVTCELGHRHWGALGAAGVLLVHGDAVLMQHRIGWSHHGDTWSIPGGAIHAGETALAASVRELREETGIVAPVDDPLAEHVQDHGNWSYTTFVMAARSREESSIDFEQVGTRWVALPDVERLPLHPGFAASWADLRGLVG
jgi:8-oxo-dGTP pyrophosphatase MutT (NUDIX family)